MKLQTVSEPARVVVSLTTAAISSFCPAESTTRGVDAFVVRWNTPEIVSVLYSRDGQFATKVQVHGDISAESRSYDSGRSRRSDLPAAVDPDAPELGLLKLIDELGFEGMAKRHPQKFLATLNLLHPGTLTFALEIAGEVLGATEVLPTLIAFTNHERPVVREGALRGLNFHLGDNGALARVKEMSTTDPSSGVKEVAIEILGLQRP